MTATFAQSTNARRPLRGVSFWILALILILSPLPLASVWPVWVYVAAVLMGTGLLIFVFDRWRLGRRLPAVPWPALSAGVLALGVAGWGYLQATPDLLPGWHHPLWAETAALLGQPDLPGYLSLDPERSFRIATLLVTYVVFGLLVVWHSRRQRNRELLLKLFLGAQAVYAVYGLSVYFSGAETILWLEKWAYQGVLTSTFVNRNSYATYAGLGALTALVLLLRYLRRTLEREIETRLLVRELLEALTSKGWLLPVILMALVLAVLLTESRMGLTALLLSGTVLLLAWTALLRGGRARHLGMSLAGLMLGLLLINFVLSGGLTAERFTLLFERGDGRFQVYPLLWQAIDARPWLGYGLGAFESTFRLFRDATIVAFFDRAHSDYLELILGVGWIAAGLMFAAFALLLASAWWASRRHREPELPLLALAATLLVAIHATVDFSLQMPAVVFGYLFLALVHFSDWGRPGSTRDHDDEVT